MSGRALVERLASLDAPELERALRHCCCGSELWAGAMLEAPPFATDDEYLAHAEVIWWGLDEEEWRGTFASHPRIGDRELADRWAASEQSGVEGASDDTLDKLASLNREYEDRFGYIFLICATGLDAEQMLFALRRRLTNDPAVELQVAAAEQARITRLRFERFGAEGLPPEETRMTITLSTHVLDTSTGRPAGGLDVELSVRDDDGWRSIGRKATDDDGRVGDFTGDEVGIDPGRYRLRFSSGAYFARAGAPAFHPSVDVVFTVPGDDRHVHVPLLLSPFGYTTYRGS